MFNAGKIKIYKKKDTKTVTGMAINDLEYIGDAFYDDIGITANEYYAALQANTKITRRICIRDLYIDNTYIIELDNIKYEVGRVFTKNGKTEITLSKII